MIRWLILTAATVLVALGLFGAPANAAGGEKPAVCGSIQSTLDFMHQSIPDLQVVGVIDGQDAFTLAGVLKHPNPEVVGRIAVYKAGVSASGMYMLETYGDNGCPVTVDGRSSKMGAGLSIPRVRFAQIMAKYGLKMTPMKAPGSDI